MPTDWKVIEDDFVIMHCVNTSYIGTTLNFAPQARPDDGVMWLVVVRSGATKAEIVNVLLSFETGEHVHSTRCDLIPVEAFRLEPQKGFIVVDGELIENDSIQVELLPSYIRIVSK